MNPRTVLAAFAAVFLLAVPTQSEARRIAGIISCDERGCRETATPRFVRERPARALKQDRSYRRAVKAMKRDSRKAGATRGASKGVRIASIHRIETRIVDHPPGCPTRAFCGCGTALHVFGKNIREAWLARWWFRFPAASPGPGKVAVRRNHVFAILRDLGGGRVLAYDPNSGGHKTRIHVRSLAGYSVRDPGGRRVASAL